MHTFNEPVVVEDQLYYMVFYNQMTGILKFFYYHKGVNLAHNNDFWQIDFESKSQAIANATYAVAVPANFKNNANYMYSCTLEHPFSKESAIVIGWNLFEMPLAYDPDANSKMQTFVKAYSFTTLDVVLSGTSTGNINGTIIKDISTNPFSKLENSMYSFVDGKAQDFIKNKIGPDVTNNLTDIIMGGVSALLKGGVHTVFNHFLGCFSKNNPEVQKINLTVQLKSNITGTIESPMPVNSVNGHFPIGEEYSGLKLGAWNLADVPTIYMHPVGVLYNAPFGTNSDENEYLFCASGKYKTDILINPQLHPHIKSYRIICTPICIESTGASDDYLPNYPGDINDLGSLAMNNSSITVTPLTTYAHGNVYNNSNDIISIEKGNNCTITTFAHDAKGIATLWNLWATYGKPGNNENIAFSPLYKYFFAPGNYNLIRGGDFKYRGQGQYLRVTFYATMEFEGKEHYFCETRTYKPRFEWDPELVAKYNGVSMKDLQQYVAETDKIITLYDKRIPESNMIINNGKMLKTIK